MNTLLNYPGAKWGMASEVLWCNFDTPGLFDLMEQEDV